MIYQRNLHMQSIIKITQRRGIFPAISMSGGEMVGEADTELLVEELARCPEYVIHHF